MPGPYDYWQNPENRPPAQAPNSLWGGAGNIQETGRQGQANLQSIPNAYRDLANDQWTRSQQGAQQGQQYLNPAWNYANAAANRGPGAFENAYGSLYGQAAGPGQSGAAWDYARGQLQQDPYSRQSFDNLNGYLQNPSAISGVYGSYQSPGALNAAYGQSQQFFSGPGMGQGMADQFTGQMRGPGQGEAWYQQNQGAFSQPTSTAKLYQNNWGGYGTAGASEDLNRYSAIGNQLENNYGQLAARQDFLKGQSATEKGGAEIGGAYREAGNLARGANQTEGYAARNLPGMEREGLHEEFVRGAMNGTNPYLNNIEDEGMARINQEMARRGHFDSGGAGVALGKFGAQMAGEKFKALGDLTQSAQSLGLQRGQQGLGYAQASDTGTLNRGQGIHQMGGGLQSLTGQQEGERMGREKLSTDIDAITLNSRQRDRDFDLQAAAQADQTRLARLQGMGNLAGQNDAGNLAMLNAGQGAAYGAQGAAQGRMAAAYGMGNQQDQYGLSRTMSGLQAGQMADQGRLADWQMRGQLANMTDTTGLGRQMAGFNAAQGLDATNYQRLGQYMQGAGQADATQLARLGMQAGLAGQMQDYGRQGMMDTYGMLQGAGQAQAGSAYNWGALGMNAYGQGMGDYLNSQMDLYMLDMQRRGQRTSPFEAPLAIGGAALGGVYGGPAGAAAGYQIGRGVGGYAR